MVDISKLQKLEFPRILWSKHLSKFHYLFVLSLRLTVDSNWHIQMLLLLLQEHRHLLEIPLGHVFLVQSCCDGIQLDRVHEVPVPLLYRESDQSLKLKIFIDVQGPWAWHVFWKLSIVCRRSQMPKILPLSSILLMPHWFCSRRSQTISVPTPKQDTKPTPVTTTRRGPVVKCLIQLMVPVFIAILRNNKGKTLLTLVFFHFGMFMSAMFKDSIALTSDVCFFQFLLK